MRGSLEHSPSHIVCRFLGPDVEGQLELEQTVTLVPIDMAVEAQQTPAVLVHRGGYGVERDDDLGFTLASLEYALDCTPDWAVFDHMAFGLESFGSRLERVARDLPCARQSVPVSP